MMDETSRELTAFASILGLAGFVLLVVVVASTGAMFKPGAWYEALAKPLWTPPNWLFPVAWTILYLMIAVAGWLVWREAGLAGAGPALTLYFLQLILNAAWSWLFFGLHRMDLAMIDIVALWLAVAATIAAFYAVSLLAALLLVPYLAWVSYAAALNFAIWQANT
jgi:tryptophan-rich sensory protein